MAAYAAAWMAIMSIAGAIVCVRDKRAARRSARRVSERALWMLSLLGGATGMLIAMLAVRHKTRKLRFMIGVPLLAAAQLVLLVYLCASVL